MLPHSSTWLRLQSPPSFEGGKEQQAADAHEQSLPAMDRCRRRDSASSSTGGSHASSSCRSSDRDVSAAGGQAAGGGAETQTADAAWRAAGQSRRRALAGRLLLLPCVTIR